MTNQHQRFQRIMDRLREQEARRIAANLPIRFYQARCDIDGCSTTIEAGSPAALAKVTEGWFIGMDDSEPNGCPKHAEAAVKIVAARG